MVEIPTTFLCIYVYYYYNYIYIYIYGIIIVYIMYVTMYLSNIHICRLCRLGSSKKNSCNFSRVERRAKWSWSQGFSLCCWPCCRSGPSSWPMRPDCCRARSPHWQIGHKPQALTTNRFQHLWASLNWRILPRNSALGSQRLKKSFHKS